MTGGAVVLLRCPCPDDACAARIAAVALDARLAAAATTTAGDSRYLWEGRLHHHAETVLTLTTLDACRMDLCALIARHHPYALPAITWVTAGATRATADWVATACGPDDRG